MEIEAITQVFNIYCDESCYLDLPGVSIYPLRELCAIIEKRKKTVAVDWGLIVANQGDQDR